MTYAELLVRLSSLDIEQLKQTVTVHVNEVDEYYGVDILTTSDDSNDVLDPGHLVLEI